MHNFRMATHDRRRETGHSGMTKYQIEDGARHSPRVSGAVVASEYARSRIIARVGLEWARPR
eukprot:COSAG02_NODE_281_length_25776_cov_37.797998_20_plen_62_part_00